MSKHYKLIGLGIGPFNLSLAALLSKTRVGHVFYDQKPSFNWHSELMFSDAEMQTSFLKDLATPVDPTNAFTFLNYLNEHGLFYSFMNTDRKVVTRREFEMYCQWVSRKLSEKLEFGTEIREVSFKDNNFLIRTDKGESSAENISLATGLVPRIPECAEPFINGNVFHAKSGHLKSLDVSGKRVLIVGGGQTGIEVLRNCLHGMWGKPRSIRLVTSRHNLEPLDESPFINEYFTPSYVKTFYQMAPQHKDPIVVHQKLASDGNTPQYLRQLYNELYHMRFVENFEPDLQVLPQKRLFHLEKSGNSYTAHLANQITKSDEVLEADCIILCTGFKNSAPAFLEPIKHLMHFDEKGRFLINEAFDLKWSGPKNRKIYALNFSRHLHGIAEPQTSLMAWRAATIINDILDEKFYLKNPSVESILRYSY